MKYSSVILWIFAKCFLPTFTILSFLRLQRRMKVFGNPRKNAQQFSLPFLDFKFFKYLYQGIFPREIIIQQK